LSRRGIEAAGSCPAPPSTLSGGPLCHDDSPTGALRLPRGTPRRDDFRRARLAVTVVGLERRTTNEPEHLPSDRPEALRPERARPRLLFTCAASPRTLSFAAIRACLVKDWPVASNYPALLRPPRSLETTAINTRKMRLTDFCNRLDYTSTLRTARFPAAPSTHVTPRGVPRARAPTHPGPRATRRRGWGLALRLPDESTRWSFA